MNLADGQSQALKCSAYYIPKDGGAQVGVVLRCAGVSNKVELRANLISNGNRLSGSWEEGTLNAWGSVRGQASPTQIKLAINGGGVFRLNGVNDGWFKPASLDINTRLGSQGC
jgi:hypothetical protein